MKRKLSILLAATMVASMLPTGVFAASVNNVTNVPSASTNSEWSLKEGNTTYAPQATFKASSVIPKGEMVTLTLSGAEWAFYNTGIGLDDGSTFKTTNNDYLERFEKRFSDPKALGDLENASTSPSVPENASSISANGSGANSQAYYNLAAAAVANPNSSDADNGAVSKPGADSDIPDVKVDYKYDAATGAVTINDTEILNRVGSLKEDEKLLGENTVAGLVYLDEDKYTLNGAQIEAIGGSTVKQLKDELATAKKNYSAEKKEYEAAIKVYEEAKIDYENAKAKYDTYGTDKYKEALDEAKVDLNNATTAFTKAQTAFDKAKDAILAQKQKIDDAATTLTSEIVAKQKAMAAAQKALDTAKANKEKNPSDPYYDVELEKAQKAYDDAKKAYDDIEFKTAARSSSSKTVTAVNFYDVTFDAANVISFRITEDLKVNDRIAIPLLVKVYDASPTISITSATGAISSNTYTIAKVSSGATLATISSAVSFAETANLYPIVISETNPGAFVTTTGKRTNDIRITLPAGFSWVATGKTSTGERTSGYITSNNKSINNGTKDGDIYQNDTANKKFDKLDYLAGKAVIDGSDNGILTISLTNDDYDSTANDNYISKITLTGAKIEASKSTAKEGDVKVNLKGTNLTSQTLVIAKYGDYKLKLSVDKVPDRIAGRSYMNDEENVESGVVRFSENVEDSWWANRRTEFVVNRGDIRAVQVKVLDDVTEAGDGDGSTTADGARTGITHAELTNGVRVVNAKEDLSGEVVANKDGVDGGNRDLYLNGYYDVAKSNGDSDFGKYMYITTLEGTNEDFRRFIMNEFVIESTRNNIASGERKTMADMELTFYVEVPALSDGVDKTEDKDLTVTLKAPGEEEQTVKITNLKEPITIERVNKDINLGYKTTELGAVTISENFVGGFVPVEKRSVMYKDQSSNKVEDRLKLYIDGDDPAVKAEMTYNIDNNDAPDTPKAVTDGKVVGDILISDGKIKRESTTLSKITITPTIDLKRFLPEGKYDFKVVGIDEIGSDVVIPDYVNIITAAENKNTKYASDVKIVADGTTTTMSVDGKEVTMNAAAYINEDDYVMLPLRDVAKALGISEDNISFVDGWATVAANGIFVQAKSGDTNLYINGNPVPMGTSAYINPANERMFLPIGFIANAFGIEKSWDGTTKTATLNPSVPVGTGSSTGETAAK